MRRNSLLEVMLGAVVFAVGAAQLFQVPAMGARLAHRTVAPFGRLAALVSTPSAPEPAAPAAPLVLAEARQACTEARAQAASERAVRIASRVVRVQDTPVMVETITDAVAARAFVRPNPERILRFARVRVEVPRLQQEEINRMIARAIEQQKRAERLRLQHEGFIINF